jgi:hypothetical protein
LRRLLPAIPEPAFYRRAIGQQRKLASTDKLFDRERFVDAFLCTGQPIRPGWHGEESTDFKSWTVFDFFRKKECFRNLSKSERLPNFVTNGHKSERAEGGPKKKWPGIQTYLQAQTKPNTSIHAIAPCLSRERFDYF